MSAPVLKTPPTQGDALRSVVQGLSQMLAPPPGRFDEYKFEPWRYVKDFFGWSPWSGGDAAGQMEVMEAYVEAIREQLERKRVEEEYVKLHPNDPRRAVLKERIDEWPVIQNWIRVESGHTTGKTKLASGLVSHFFDCFSPSITYCFAPTYNQVNDLLFKEIRTDRAKAPQLPGRVLKTPDITYTESGSGNHFVKGKAIGRGGTEAVHGQHNEYLMFVLDEAEGVPSFVYEAVQSMMGGGVGVCLMIANPRTNTSRFHTIASMPYVRSFRMSCLNHPNVVEGAEIVPNAVRRQYVERMLIKHCTKIAEHDHDRHTFTLPWDRDGQIYLPDNEFLFRVMGIAPPQSSIDTYVPVGRFEHAAERQVPEGYNLAPNEARIGVDCARYGDDVGTIYVHYNGYVWREKRITQQDGYAYYTAILALLDELEKDGVTDIQVRVDAGGGYGSSVIDFLNNDHDLFERFDLFRVAEVHFNASATGEDANDYHDLITAMYAYAGEVLLSLVMLEPSQTLKGDLTERRYTYRRKKGVDLQVLETKELFRKRVGRSPDDGDGFVMAVAPDRFFEPSIDIGYA